MTALQLPVRLEHDPDSPGGSRLYDDGSNLVKIVDDQASVATDGSHTRFATWDEGAAVRDRLNREGVWELPSFVARKSHE